MYTHTLTHTDRQTHMYTCMCTHTHTLKDENASEAISKVDISTKPKNLMKWSLYRMSLARGSYLMHSLSIVPQLRAISGLS